MHAMHTFTVWRQGHRGRQAFDAPASPPLFVAREIPGRKPGVETSTAATAPAERTKTQRGTPERSGEELLESPNVRQHRTAPVTCSGSAACGLRLRTGLEIRPVGLHAVLFGIHQPQDHGLPPANKGEEDG